MCHNMGIKAAIEALRQAEELKQQIMNTEPKDFASHQTIALQKQLQHLYRHIFIVDINYGLENKIDQDLWNIGFKLGISSLQDLVKNKQCSPAQKSEYSALLCWYLSGASGFFLSLLNSTWGARKDLTESRTELSHLAQFCLVHLGDLSRYQGHKEQAQNYYEHAIKLASDFGHAYNQLALLEPPATPMDALKICSLYCRAACAPQSFGPAHNNLMRLLEEYKKFECNRLTKVDDYVSAFLKQIYYVLNNSIYDMNIENPKFLMLNETQYIERFILILYAYYRIVHSNSSKETELSKDEQISKRIILKLILHLFVVPDSNNSFDKSIYLILSWIVRNKHLMTEPVFVRAHKDLEKCFQLITDTSEPYLDKEKIDGVTNEEYDLGSYLPFGKQSNTSLIQENIQEATRKNRLLEWSKEFLDVIVNSSVPTTYDFDENMEESTNKEPDAKLIISKTGNGETSKIKPKTKSRTNVAMQAILQMQQNRNSPSSDCTPCLLPNITLNSSTEENPSVDECDSGENSLRTLFNLPTETPPLPPMDWVKETETKDDILNNSLFTNYLDESNKSSYNPFMTVNDNASSSIWGASYSLFSGHSPLEKLLEEQKTKHDTSVIK